MAVRKAAKRTSKSSAKQYVAYYIEFKDDSGGKGAKGDGIKFAWNAPTDAYTDEVAKALGVAKAKDNETGLVFGMNKPRPARVRINIQVSQGSNKSALLFCNPSKVTQLLLKNPIKGKTFRGGKITSVSLPGTSTNPNRKGSSDSKPTTAKKATKRTSTKKKNSR